MPFLAYDGVGIGALAAAVPKNVIKNYEYTDHFSAEEVKAVVEPMNWADATDETAIEIMEWLRERISHIKMPRSLDFHPKLPRTDAGKLYKRHLVDEYRGGTRSDDKTE